MADRHVIYKNGVEGDRGAARPRGHVHGEVLLRRGRLVVPRPLEPVVGRRRHDALDVGRRPHPTTSRPRCAAGSAARSRAARELAWMYAPTVNSYKRYQPESWAPTALGVERRQPHVRVPHRRPRRVVPPRVAHPRRRREPLPRVRGDDRGRTARHRARPRSRAAASTATPTRRSRPRPRAATASSRRSTRSPSSKVAADAFGADVHDHLLNTARQEWAHFNRAVTDWERRRNFDQW